LRANGKAPEPLLKRVGVTGAAKAAWEARRKRRAPGEGQAFDPPALPPPGPDVEPVDTTHPVAVTPPVLPLGGKPTANVEVTQPHEVLPPPGQVELPLEPPTR
jgi:hypothetical protein